MFAAPRSEVLLDTVLCGCKMAWLMSSAGPGAGMLSIRGTRLGCGSFACYLEWSMSWRREIRYGKCPEVLSYDQTGQ